jgi:hypothetical protein
MPDVNRKPNEQSIHHVHTHVCPVCNRPYNCNCHAQPETEEVVCRDCEMAGK